MTFEQDLKIKCNNCGKTVRCSKWPSGWTGERPAMPSPPRNIGIGTINASVFGTAPESAQHWCDECNDAVRDASKVALEARRLVAGI